MMRESKGLMRGQNSREISIPKADNPDPAYDIAIRSRLDDAAKNRGRHPQTLEAIVEALLLETAHRCGYRPAESARFLLAMNIAIGEANLAALDRREDGLINDIVPSIARSLVLHSTRRIDVKE